MSPNPKLAELVKEAGEDKAQLLQLAAELQHVSSYIFTMLGVEEKAQPLIWRMLNAP